MGRWFQISPLLAPQFALRTCSHVAHSDLIETLREVARIDQMPICEHVAYVGYHWNDIFLNQLSDRQLFMVARRLPRTTECTKIADEVMLVLQARSAFRQSLHPRVLLIALLRDQIKCRLEHLLDGNLSISSIYTYAARDGCKDRLKPVINDFYTRFDRHRDKPDTRLILKGCMDVDRII
jgi:hypothetical protein